MVDYWATIPGRFPVLFLEDGMAEGDWDGWHKLTERIGSRVQLVGDDVFVTNPAILREGIERGVANSILIKLNQIGTVTETLDTITIARDAGYRAVVSHRSGRDRGHVHRGFRRGDRRRADQDRRAGPLRARREVQPADADRGGAGQRALATRAATPSAWAEYAASVPIELEIPGRGRLLLDNVLLDINGTLSDRGALIDTAQPRLGQLAAALTVHLLSADTFGSAESIAAALGARWRRVTDGSAKLDYLEQLGAERCAAIGNGTNDVLMLERCALGIAVLGPEGTSAAALRAADVVCRSIDEALDLLLAPTALVATLRV